MLFTSFSNCTLLLWCPTFRDVAYCHHILAIIKFNLANIIIDPMYVEPEKPKKLHTKKTRRVRPAKNKKASAKKFYLLTCIRLYCFRNMLSSALIVKQHK